MFQPSPLALAAMLLLGTSASLAQSPAAAPATPPTPAAPAAPRDDERDAPVSLEADRISGQPDRETQAEGGVALQRGRVTIRTDRLTYDSRDGRASALGNVRILTAQGDRFSGPELQLDLDSFEGFFVRPEYYFARTRAGGRADRIDFLGTERSNLTGASYTSCTIDGRGTPGWLLSADRVQLDFTANEGIADGAVLRFLGVPILAAPTLSFPLSDARKSGWLPPSINLDNKSGLELAVPYYWNIAPNRDATLTPVVYSRRGVGIDGEARYLEPRHRGEVQWHWLPTDRVADAARYALQWQQAGSVADWRWSHEGVRVSDDSYWKDFPRLLGSITPRLLPLAAQGARDWRLGGVQTTFYARAQHWQVLQDADPQALIAAPYHRVPQLGWRGGGRLAPWAGLRSGADIEFETELNRFELATNDASTGRVEGWRAHALASIRQSWRTPGAWLTPKLAVNLASYHTDTPMADGRQRASRGIPTLSVDSGLIFERAAQWRGRNLLQTLEPRLLYVSTPYRQQASLPLFDTAPKDFNIVSIFSDNDFYGVDRVSDSHHLTAGVVTRLIEPATGVEALRMGVAQRYLLGDQQISPDGAPLTQRLSELLFFGSAKLSARWSFDGALQFSTETDRVSRSLLTARYTPGPMRTIAASYRLARGASEQVDVGWQWPLYGNAPAAGAARAGAGSGSSCRGVLYGVGRINYSTRDSRITDSLAGFEYDAGCWIGRAVAERVSTGRSEATTRLLFQLELVGLSRLGSNPLQVLKDNIPGYQLLREERKDPPLRSYP